MDAYGILIAPRHVAIGLIIRFAAMDAAAPHVPIKPSIVRL
jgi:hypothetical protein